QDPLPSVRQLAKELDVSTITIKRAYIDLEHDGFIYTLSGRGTFVNKVDVSKLLLERNKKLIEEYKQKTIEIKESGIEKQTVINIIEEIYRG
ncbi:MAG: GntR family transcriptional regulator, partial [Bacillota bacterium]|nr:GntR family transcriptional regulator [Bacillota bacterium]